MVFKSATDLQLQIFTEKNNITKIGKIKGANQTLSYRYFSFFQLALIFS